MSEHAEQVALFQWVAVNTRAMPELELIFAIPNGGARTPITGAMLKAEGVRAGVPDICLPVARKGFAALYIELKAKGGKMQQNQIDWQQKLNDAGNLAVTCVGWEAARSTIKDYLSPEVGSMKECQHCQTANNVFAIKCSKCGAILPGADFRRGK